MISPTCQACGRRLMEGGKFTRCSSDWQMHRPPEVMVPTAGHARRALVFALRHIAEAERRRACAAVFAGISNRRAVELVRRLLRGQPDDRRISLLTWQVVRAIGNATPHTASKAWWNAERWQLPDAAVRARLDALRRGKP